MAQPITVVIIHPAATAVATSLPLSITNLWVANVLVPLSPTPGVILGNSQAVIVGAETHTSSGILFYMTAADQLLYKREESTSVPSATSVSTTVTSASASSSQPQATTGTNVDNGIPPAPTSNSTAPSPSHSAKSSTNSGLQPGAAAGLAIGCLLAGIIIAGALFWFLCGKRRRSRSQYDTNSLPLVAQEKGFSNQTTALHGKGSPAVPLISSLPQPLEDKVISGDISKTSNSIKNHVQSYYHTSRVSQVLVDHDDIQTLGPKMPIAIGTLSTLLANSATREIALRFCIAWAIISRMQESSAQSNGLLPAEIAGCFRQIMRTQSNSTSQAAQTSQWRTMTAELMHSTYVRNPFSPSDSRNASIQGIIRALDNVLQPYADSRMDNEQRKRNLEEVIKRSALFAFTLFSQSSLWEFDWKEEQGVKSGELCIFPALVQVVDENGEAVRPPRPFSEAVVRPLEGIESSWPQVSAGL